ncbi:MAG: class I SAM-dependent methyltransferase [Nitrolancea sp.]
MTERAPERFVSVCCDLCGADDPAPMIDLTDRMFHTTDEVFHLVRCRRCGHLYLNPRPGLAYLERYYAADYAPFARSGIAGRVKRWTISREVDELWPSLKPPACVVDVGSATGDLLAAIRMHGNPNVLGIEPSEHAARLARERSGIETIVGTLEEAELATGSVDVLLMSHTIEHLPSPSNTLAEMARVLAPDGTLILWLPNADSISARLLSRWWIGYDAPRHFHDFTPDSLRRLLAKQGFKIEKIRQEWIGLEWSWALRLMAHERLQNARLDVLLARIHPLLTIGLTPVSGVAAIARRAGRIRVVARRRGDPS